MWPHGFKINNGVLNWIRDSHENERIHPTTDQAESAMAEVMQHQDARGSADQAPSAVAERVTQPWLRGEWANVAPEVLEGVDLTFMDPLYIGVLERKEGDQTGMDYSFKEGKCSHGHGDECSQACKEMR